MLLQHHDINSAKSKLYVLMGPQAKQPAPMEEGAACILCGNCLAPTFYNNLKGTFVPGCPPSLEDFKQALGKYLAPRKRLSRREWQKILKKMEKRGFKGPHGPPPFLPPRPRGEGGHAPPS